jgi:hypothetical protein
MMQAHPAPSLRYPCPGCATCRRQERRDRMLAVLVIVVFAAIFVVPTVLRWHG